MNDIWTSTESITWDAFYDSWIIDKENIGNYNLSYGKHKIKGFTQMHSG